MVNLSELKKCDIITSGTFVRKGQSNGWKDMFSEELNAKANKWIEENLKGNNFSFPYFNDLNSNYN